MLDMAAFGGRLRTLRCSRGLTQRDVATVIRVSERAVSKWEHGAVLSDAEHLLLVVRTLRTSVDALLGADAGELVLRTIRVGGACLRLCARGGNGGAAGGRAGPPHAGVAVPAGPQ